MTPEDIDIATERMRRREHLLDRTAWAVSAALWIGTARILFPSYFPF